MTKFMPIDPHGTVLHGKVPNRVCQYPAVMMLLTYVQAGIAMPVAKLKGICGLHLKEQVASVRICLHFVSFSHLDRLIESRLPVLTGILEGQAFIKRIVLTPP